MIRSRHTILADEQPLDPQVAADLDALDAALRGDAIDDEVLAALVRDVQAGAPEMPSDLRKRLRHDVAEGFPRRGAAARRRRAGRAAIRRPRLVVGSSVAGLAGAAVIAAVVIPSVGMQRTIGKSSSETASAVRAEPQMDDLASSASASAGASGGAGSTTGQANAYNRDGVVNDSSVTTDAELAGKLRGAVSQSTTSAGTAAAPAPKPLRPYSRSTSSAPALAPTATARKVERAVDMAVRVKSGKLDDAVAGVGQIARQSGGYVADSQVSLRARGAGSASFTLRVGSAKLDTTIGKLSALGTVTHQDQQSTDITSSFDSAQQRLRDANAERRALLRALDKATTGGQIASLRARIADNRTLRASLDRQLSQLNRRVDLTTITLTLTAPTSGAAAAIDDNGTWSLGDAAHDTIRILGTVTGALLVAAGAALPFAILALLAWPIHRVRRRRSREAALGA